jgi:hypothetical protein
VHEARNVRLSRALVVHDPALLRREHGGHFDARSTQPGLCYPR